MATDTALIGNNQRLYRKNGSNGKNNKYVRRGSGLATTRSRVAEYIATVKREELRRRSEALFSVSTPNLFTASRTEGLTRARSIININDFANDKNEDNVKDLEQQFRGSRQDLSRLISSCSSSDNDLEDGQESSKMSKTSLENLESKEAVRLLLAERAKKREIQRVLSQLQTNYDTLQQRLAEAENKIDRLRLGSANNKGWDAKHAGSIDSAFFDVTNTTSNTSMLLCDLDVEVEEQEHVDSAKSNEPLQRIQNTLQKFSENRSTLSPCEAKSAIRALREDLKHEVQSLSWSACGGQTNHMSLVVQVERIRQTLNNMEVEMSSDNNVLTPVNAVRVGSVVDSGYPGSERSRPTLRAATTSSSSDEDRIRRYCVTDEKLNKQKINSNFSKAKNITKEKVSDSRNSDISKTFLLSTSNKDTGQDEDPTTTCTAPTVLRRLSTSSDSSLAITDEEIIVDDMMSQTTKVLPECEMAEAIEAEIAELRNVFDHHRESMMAILDNTNKEESNTKYCSSSEDTFSLKKSKKLTKKKINSKRKVVSDTKKSKVSSDTKKAMSTRQHESISALFPSIASKTSKTSTASESESKLGVFVDGKEGPVFIPQLDLGPHSSDVGLVKAVSAADLRENVQSRASNIVVLQCCSARGAKTERRRASHTNKKELRQLLSSLDKANRMARMLRSKSQNLVDFCHHQEVASDHFSQRSHR